jgi:hypothetical protein
LRTVTCASRRGDPIDSVDGAPVSGCDIGNVQGRGAGVPRLFCGRKVNRQLL